MQDGAFVYIEECPDFHGVISYARGNLYFEPMDSADVIAIPIADIETNGWAWVRNKLGLKEKAV